MAVLLARPGSFRGPETVNDWSCHLINAWRAIVGDPEELARLCVAPSAEVDKEARHYALVSSELSLRDQLGDPTHYDIHKAAWYIKGACEWIGGGYCSGEGPWQWSKETGWAKKGNAGKGVNRQLPHLGNAGTGVNRQLPHLGDAGTGEYEKRIEWVSEWLCALCDRLCHTRIACGDWKRVLGKATTTKHAGITGVFLDPPYESTEYVYGKQTDTSLSAQCREWCVANGTDKKLRIVLAGRGTEHDELLSMGWARHEWKTRGGYGSDNAETYWASPGCQYTEDIQEAKFELYAELYPDIFS